MEVPQNRVWMYNRVDPTTKWYTQDFIQGVQHFLSHALEASSYSKTSKNIRCPCVKCKCKPYLNAEEVKTHIYKFGFMPNYYIWNSHGEIEIDYHSTIPPSYSRWPTRKSTKSICGHGIRYSRAKF